MFLKGGPQNVIFRSDLQATHTYCGRSLFSPQPGWFVPCRAMGAERVNGCQGTPWSEELDEKGTPRSAWWRVRSGAERIRDFLHIVNMVNPSFIIYYKCGIMLILKCWCSPCTAVMQYNSNSYSSVFLSRSVPLCIWTCDFRKKFALPNPRAAFLALAASVVLSRRVVP